MSHSETFLRKAIRNFEGNTHAQFRFHMIMAVFWLLGMVVIPFIHVFASNLVGTLIMEVSLYANFATEYGSATTQGAVLKGEK